MRRPQHHLDPLRLEKQAVDPVVLPSRRLGDGSQHVRNQPLSQEISDVFTVAQKRLRPSVAFLAALLALAVLLVGWLGGCWTRTAFGPSVAPTAAPAQPRALAFHYGPADWATPA